MELNKLYEGNCLEIMPTLADKPVDMILCDLPYGTTACKWDTIIPFEPLWAQYKRLIKDNGAIVLTASQPFTSALVMSNPWWFKYSWVWEKSKGSNFVHARNMPIKFHEDVYIFSKAKIGHDIQLSEKRMTYNPQGLLKTDRHWSRPKKYNSEHDLDRPSHSLDRIIEFENYPRSVLKFSNSDNRERGKHPTQKPVALFEYLIRTYTNEGDTVLDNCAGSGTTAIACLNTKRNYILIEKSPDYCNIIGQRIEQHIKPKVGFFS